MGSQRVRYNLATKQQYLVLIFKVWITILQTAESCYIQFSSVTQSYPTLWPHEPQHPRPPCPSQLHVHWVGDVIQPSYPLSSPSPPASIFPSIRVFLNESALCIRRPKYWHQMAKEMATHSSILAWEIPWTEEPARLQSMGSQKVGCNLVTKQQHICMYVCIYLVF